jgi:hypothetical protein
MLVDHPSGGYRFLAGIDPYSCGVVAAPQHRIVHVVLARPLPWRQGFARAEDHLEHHDRPRSALCGVELRSPAPFTMAGFIAFNRAYCELLQDWEVYVGDLNPVARTNVAPVECPPEDVVMHAFFFTQPCDDAPGPSFVVAGAGELREGILEEDRILLRGHTDPPSLRSKASYVMDVMEERLWGLGCSWDQVRTVDVYTVHLHEGLLETAVLPRLGGAARHGVHWYPTRPPVVDIEYEMDLRGVHGEQVIA